MLLTEVLTIIGIIVAATLIVIGLLRFWIKDNTKASLATIVVLGALFSYGAVHAVLFDKLRISIGGATLGDHWHLLPIAAVFALAIIYWIVSTKRNLAILLNAGVLIVALLIVMNAGKIVIAGMDSGGNSTGNELADTATLTVPADTGQLPNVCYIVLDSYGRADTLQENLGFDNFDFVNGLAARGFLSATKAGQITSSPNGHCLHL